MRLLSTNAGPMAFVAQSAELRSRSLPHATQWRFIPSHRPLRSPLCSQA